MMEDIWFGESWVSDYMRIQCGECHQPLWYRDAVSIVLTKATGAGDTPETAPVHLLVCRACSGIPADLDGGGRE